MTGRNFRPLFLKPPSFLKRAFKVLGISIAVLVMVVVLFLSVFDFGLLKQNLVTLVSDTTGREFNIKGAFSLKLLPAPTLLVEDVTLANAGWGSEENMLHARKVYLKVNALALLQQQLVVEEFELSDVQVLVESHSDEKLNWHLARHVDEKVEVVSEPEKETELNDLPLAIESASLSKIKVIYRQAGSDDIRFVIDAFKVEQNEEKSSKFNAKAQIKAKSMEIPLSVVGLVKEHYVELDADVGKVKLLSQYHYPNDSVDFNLSLSTLAELGSLLDITGLPKEDLSLSGKVALSDGNVLLNDVVASMTGVRVAMSGQVDTESSSIQLNVDASGEKLSVFNADLPAIPFSLKSDIKIADNVLATEPYAIQFGNSRISGKAHVETGEAPTIRIDAQSDAIDLSPFMAKESQESEAGPDPDPKPDSQKASDQKTKYVFDETPLPLDHLQTVNLAVNADIGRLTANGNEIKNLKLDLEARKGDIRLDNQFEGKYSGHFNTNLALKSSNRHADVKLSTTVRDFKIALLSGDAVSVDQIPITNMDIDLHSRGDTPRTIASNLDGKLVVNQGKGKVSNNLIGAFSGDILSQLFSALNPFSKDEEYSNWECSLFLLNFDSGFGSIEGFLMQSEKLMVVGGGEIDLNEESLDIEFNTKPRKGVGISADMFVTPFVKLSGTLAQPSVGLNKKGALLSGGAAVLTGGMSFLYTGMMDRVTAEADQCEQAIIAISNTRENPSKLPSSPIKLTK